MRRDRVGMAAGPSAADAIRVFIVDDHAIVRHGLTSYLSVAAGIDVVGEAADGAEAVAAIADLISTGRAPDVALVDLVMPGLDGIGVAEALRRLPGSPRVVILSSFGEVEHLRSALRAGVSGYVLKSTPAEAIADAIRAVSSGKLQLDPALSGSLAEAVSPSGAAVSLTAREREVVALVARGKSNRDVAAAMYISERTARTHVSHLLGKLGLESRIQLAIWAHANGFPLASPDEIARTGSHRASGSLARITRRTAAGALLVMRRPGFLERGRGSHPSRDTCRGLFQDWCPFP
jgi:DNA-binding NarL/FixJ family response regulator